MKNRITKMINKLNKKKMIKMSKQQKKMLKNKITQKMKIRKMKSNLKLRKKKMMILKNYQRTQETNWIKQIIKRIRTKKKANKLNNHKIKKTMKIQMEKEVRMMKMIPNQKKWNLLKKIKKIIKPNSKLLQKRNQKRLVKMKKKFLLN